MKFFFLFAVINCICPPRDNALMAAMSKTVLVKNTLKTGANFAMGNPAVPFEAKLVVGVGRAVVDGTNAYIRSKSIVEASKAVATSGLDSTNRVLLTRYAGISRNIAGFLKDIYSGIDIQCALTDRCKQAFLSFPSGKVVKIGYEIRNCMNGQQVDNDVYSKCTRVVFDKVAERLKSDIKETVQAQHKNETHSPKEGIDNSQVIYEEIEKELVTLLQKEQDNTIEQLLEQAPEHHSEQTLQSLKGTEIKMNETSQNEKEIVTKIKDESKAKMKKGCLPIKFSRGKEKTTKTNIDSSTRKKKVRRFNFASGLIACLKPKTLD
ncbi:uncharacterized protein LOC116339795 [Contarinia nasturtii]|uniref:uncharacterized protein LOC116339795 n=1 Tax=Contarinia nasturtii TaxID=265458 RepID=UPI0012D49946|nr:uncharacterized protein LOC116339795 [Contarinia nasturtii]